MESDRRVLARPLMNEKEAGYDGQSVLVVPVTSTARAEFGAGRRYAIGIKRTRRPGLHDELGFECPLEHDDVRVYGERIRVLVHLQAEPVKHARVRVAHETVADELREYAELVQDILDRLNFTRSKTYR